jgi:hypothetical protein
MTINNGVMAVAGAMILISVLLSMTISGNFMWLTIFVGVMMLQSAFTGFCPMAMILKKMGLK